MRQCSFGDFCFASGQCVDLFSSSVGSGCLFVCLYCWPLSAFVSGSCIHSPLPSFSRMVTKNCFKSIPDVPTDKLNPYPQQLQDTVVGLICLLLRWSCNSGSLWSVRATKYVSLDFVSQCCLCWPVSDFSPTLNGPPEKLRWKRVYCWLLLMGWLLSSAGTCRLLDLALISLFVLWSSPSPSAFMPQLSSLFQRLAFWVSCYLASACTSRVRQTMGDPKLLFVLVCPGTQ